MGSRAGSERTGADRVHRRARLPQAEPAALRGAGSGVTAFFCETCGVQHAPRTDDPSRPPDSCPICLDERQYIGFKGQRWMTLEELRASRANHFNEPEPGVLEIDTRPGFAIG